MSAVIQDRRDVGPIQERYHTMTWSIGDVSGETELKARYRINYPTLRHRGLGIAADVQVLAVFARNSIDEWCITHLSPAQWAAVITEIEVDELPQD